MKDLYSFDLTSEAAFQTYKEVAKAYSAFFADLKLPVSVAEASSGDMGGNHSHEYHLSNPIGEDTVVTCSSCGYTANDEVATSRPTLSSRQHLTDMRVWRGISKDKNTLMNVWYPHSGNPEESPALNLHAVSRLVPDLDTSITNTESLWQHVLAEAQSNSNVENLRLINVVDSSLKEKFDSSKSGLEIFPKSLSSFDVKQEIISPDNADLLEIVEGDGCPKCESGQLKISRALELGHAFYLGTRYSVPLEAYYTPPNDTKKRIPIQMGCYGLGISRIMGTIAEHMSDSRGLKWPRVVAPFEVAVIPTSGLTDEVVELYDKLTKRDPTTDEKLDVVLDDRKANFGWKMKDADMTGYPVVVILGKAWKESKICEVQCRNTNMKENVSAEDLPNYLRDLLARV